MGALGLKTHIWNNNLRSIFLLGAFPFLLLAIIYGAQLMMMGAGMLPSTGDLGTDLMLSFEMMLTSAPMAFVVAVVWFVIAYFANQKIIDMATGARVIERRTDPDLYNLLENLAISRGLRTPTLRIIETDMLNAYATGLHEGQYSVTVTRGLVNSLNRDELEAVLAHELAHIINRDVRTMVIAAVFAGIVSLVAEMMFRSIRFMAMGGSNRGGNSSNRSAGGVLILIGLAIAVIGYVLAIVVRMSLSRTREYVADAGAVELTKNPDAMISALRKVSGQSKLEAPDELRGMFLENEGNAAIGLFNTHPPIEKRIKALMRYAGGRDEGPGSSARVSVSEAGAASSTTVPPVG